MLTGTFDHTVDDKGRLFLPAKMREELGSVLYLSQGLEPCIRLYSEREWEALAEKTADIPLYTGGDLFRILFSAAERVTVDSHGRILLPPRLKEYASISPGSAIKVLGAGRFAEIWDAEKLAAHRAAIDRERVVEALRSIGL